MRQLAAAAVLLTLTGPGLAATPSVTLAEMAASPDKPQIVLQMSASTIAPTAFALANPSRIVVDMPDTTTKAQTITGSGPVQAARLAQFTPSTARLVVDLSAPAAIIDAAIDPKTATLKLTLGPVSDDAFARAVKKGRGHLLTKTPPAAKAEVDPGIDPLTAIIGRAPPKPRAADRPAPVATRGTAKPLVVIDAGHGGQDPGALSVFEQRREKDATLAIARAVRDEIEKGGRVRVKLTRDDDRFLELPERVRLAQNAGAHLFISIHADSAPSHEARGASIYTLSEVASDKEAARLAAKENKADLLPGINLEAASSDVANILIDLAQRETMNRSSAFAGTLQKALEGHIRFRSRAHHFAGFRVLKAADTPSVLFETGYLSNEADARFLFSEDGQGAIAQGIARAVEHHFFPEASKP